VAKGRGRAALAIIVAGILSAVVTRAARSNDDLANAAAQRSIARPTTTAALHTATPAHPLRHHARHVPLAVRRHRRAHVTPELRAQKPALQPVAASQPQGPATPARESHPRAALPVIVRPVHHPTFESGSRLGAALPRTSASLPVTSTLLGCIENERDSQMAHEVSEARGPPRPASIATLSPAFAQRPISIRARIPRSTAVSKVSAPVPVPSAPEPGPERMRSVFAPGPGVATAPHHAPESHQTWVVTALPHGRADVRRLESATACCSKLSTGGVP
jgi:hypothetical protein